MSANQVDGGSGSGGDGVAALTAFDAIELKIRCGFELTAGETLALLTAAKAAVASADQMTRAAENLVGVIARLSQAVEDRDATLTILACDPVIRARLGCCHE